MGGVWKERTGGLRMHEFSLQLQGCMDRSVPGHVV